MRIDTDRPHPPRPESRGPKPATLRAWAAMDAMREDLLARIAVESTETITDSLVARGLTISIHAVRSWFQPHPEYHASIKGKRRRAGKLGGYHTHRAADPADYDRLYCRQVVPDAAMLTRLQTRLTPEARAARFVTQAGENVA